MKNAIVCFYWQGDRWQENKDSLSDSYKKRFKNHLNRVGYAPKSLVSRYVNNLFWGCKQFADREFKFILFTNENIDVDDGIEKKAFRIVSEQGVLPRIVVFSKESGLFGYQVLCLDLDVVIVNSLKDILNYDGEFCTRGMFKKGHERELDGDIMSFRACQKTEDKFWTPFVNNIEFVERTTGGRERFWIRYVTENKADNWYDIAPGQVISYKRNMGPNGRKVLPKNATIVSCHGYPRPHQIVERGESWIKSYWK